MKLVRESLMWQLLALLFSRLDELVRASFLARWTGAVWRWLGRQYRCSLLGILLGCSSRLNEKLPESLFGRALNGLLTLPGRILDRSVLVNALADFSGRWLTVLLAFCPVLILSVPYESWNNYSVLYLFLLGLGMLLLSRQRRLSLREIGFWPLAFFLLTLGSVLWSADPADSLRFGVFACICALGVLLCVHALDSGKKLLWVAFGIALGLLVCCAYGLWQRWSGIEPNAHYTDLSSNASMPGRVYSFFDNPNSFANIPVLFAPLMLSLFFFSPKLWQKLLFGLAFLLASLCLIMTYTRGAWLAWAFSLFVFALLVRPRLAPWLAVLALLCLPLLPESILARFLSIFTGDSSISSRGPIYRAILRLIKRYPVLGVGLGSTNLRAVLNDLELYTGGAYFVHGHNVLFQIWGESGVLALLSFCLASFFALRDGLRDAFRPAGEEGNLARGVLAGSACGLLGALVFGMTDYIWSYPRIMILYWFLFGLLLAAGKLRKGAQQ